MRKLIIGLGSGRCGTTTLTHLFDIQDDSFFTHEYYTTSEFGIKWKDDIDVAKKCIVHMLLYNEGNVGDVGFYWINYIPFLVSLVPHVRCVCLKRDEDSTVESFERRPAQFKTRYSFEHQLATYGDDGFKGHAFPRYKDVTPNESLRLFYNEYYEIAERMEHFYPDNFKIFDIDCLNSKKGQRDILDFAGFENHKYDVGKKLNASERKENEHFRQSTIL